VLLTTTRVTWRACQNGTAAPRALLSKVAGPKGIVEMPRHGRQTSCCGAGGGRMWFDDTADKTE